MARKTATGRWAIFTIPSSSPQRPPLCSGTATSRGRARIIRLRTISAGQWHRHTSFGCKEWKCCSNKIRSRSSTRRTTNFEQSGSISRIPRESFRHGMAIPSAITKTTRWWWTVAMLDTYGTPFSAALHVVERYRLVDYQEAIRAVERGLKEYGSPVTEQAVTIDRSYRGKGLQVQ